MQPTFNYRNHLNNPEEYFAGNKMLLDGRHIVTIKKVTPGLMFSTVTDGESEWDVMSCRLTKIEK